MKVSKIDVENTCMSSLVNFLSVGGPLCARARRFPAELNSYPRALQSEPAMAIQKASLRTQETHQCRRYCDGVRKHFRIECNG